MMITMKLKTRLLLKVDVSGCLTPFHSMLLFLTCFVTGVITNWPLSLYCTAYMYVTRSLCFFNFCSGSLFYVIKSEFHIVFKSLNRIIYYIWSNSLRAVPNPLSNLRNSQLFPSKFKLKWPIGFISCVTLHQNKKFKNGFNRLFY